MGNDGKVIRVAIAGGFDPLHAGHIDHIKKAAKLGDSLLVITHPDEVLIRKKGYCLLPLADRVAVLRQLKDVDYVAIAIQDKDGTVADTLRFWKPNIFAKGGDRTKSNMPENELAACTEIGCEIVYGIGTLINSSSDLVEKAFDSIRKKQKVDTTRRRSRVSYTSNNSSKARTDKKD